MASSTASSSSSGFNDSTSSDDEYESDSDPIISNCSPFFHQTAKIRYTRTTSTVRQHMEARRENGGHAGHLFGCLRRTNSSQTVMYQEELSSRSTPAARPNAHSTPLVVNRSRSEEAERRRVELERTRREIQRLDQLLKEKNEEAYAAENFFPLSRPDAWIAQLSSAEPDDPPTSSCCWNLCSGKQSRPPHVDLEPFSGEPRHWPDFIRRFKKWIHDAMPDDSLRMIYLEELLAPKIREDYLTFFRRPECYRSLLAHLRDHYGSPDLVVRSCLMALKQIAPMDPNDPRTVATISRQVQESVATLRMIGCESELRAFSTLEFTGVVRKLSDPLRNSWMLYSQDRSSPLPLPNLNDFAIWVEERANWFS